MGWNNQKELFCGLLYHFFCSIWQYSILTSCISFLLEYNLADLIKISRILFQPKYLPSRYSTWWSFLNFFHSLYKIKMNRMQKPLKLVKSCLTVWYTTFVIVSKICGLTPHIFELEVWGNFTFWILNTSLNFEHVTLSLVNVLILGCTKDEWRKISSKNIQNWIN